MSSFSRIVSAVVAASFLFAVPAHAGGLIAGATEPTQIMNNIELIKVAMDGATTASTTVSKYMLQIQQYQTQLENIRKLSNLPAGLRTDVITAYNDLNRYKSAVTALQGSLGMQAQAMEARLTEAKLSGMNWRDYVGSVAADAAQKQKRAVERLKYEEDVLKQVQSDYDFARQVQPTISTTSGVHQSVALLNSQMNRVVTQNAKLLEVISQSIGERAEREASKAIEEQQSVTQREAMRVRQEAIEQRQRAFGGFQ